ncbi:RagB/SusD family nutrient uptake outer membrane protein [Chryseobacterium taeanense]|uniref:RagB/SusD family nutrient uptake outer membrane protein n=1 Tax=Chryseobacterium taeanense TaxID=311334 RepID=UPI0035B04D14
MKNRYITLLMAGTLMFSVSCSNDFLEVAPTENISTADLALYNNDEGAKSFVTSAYAQLLEWDTSSFAWIGMTSITSDEADKGSDPGDAGSDKNLMDALTFDSSSGSVSDVFKGNYEGINKCNQALKYLPLLDNASQALRDRLIAETKFLRAYYYFNLVRCFGGVPIVDHVPDPASEADNVTLLTRKSATEVYAQIEKDLKDAIAGLPAKSAYGTSDIGRASKGAALGLMTKVALYQKKWADVITYGTQISGYSLTPSYSDIFKISGENNQESLFEIQSIGGPSGSTNLTSPGIKQYSQVQAPRGAGGWGWGFNTPSNTLLNAYETGDLRKDATIMFRGQTLYDGVILPSTVSNPMYNYKAYSPSFSGNDFASQNLRVIRYADVLLMLAEAYNEQGNTAQAITLVNQIRTRAGLGNTGASSLSDVRLAIWKERRFELAMEHDRWFDLIRTGQAQSAMAADGKTFVVGKHEVFPLPSSFMLQAAKYSQQNPGYN